MFPSPPPYAPSAPDISDDFLLSVHAPCQLWGHGHVLTSLVTNISSCRDFYGAIRAVSVACPNSYFTALPTVPALVYNPGLARSRRARPTPTCYAFDYVSALQEADSFGMDFLQVWGADQGINFFATDLNRSSFNRAVSRIQTATPGMPMIFLGSRAIWVVLDSSLDCRGTRSTIMSRLMRAGDVETNPGPSFYISLALLGYLANIEYGVVDRALYGANRAIRAAFPVIGECEDINLAQRRIARDNDLWFTIKEPVPLTPVICPYVAYYPGFVVRPLPPPPEPTVLNYLNWYWPALVSYSFGSGLAFVYVCARVLRGFLGYEQVYVLNPNKGLDVNPLRDSLRTAILSAKPPLVRQGEHRVLAYERRFLESWCFDTLLKTRSRVRDVGGSRSRFPELAKKKHLCNPNHDSADVFRDLKSTGTFEGCYGPGQICPERRTIDAALISHVDYYMTPQDLVNTITGPTFIINHDFSSGSTTYNALNIGTDKKPNYIYETAVCVSQDGVTMTPSGGTPYGPHGYNKWLSEGCIVSQDGAVVYARIGTYLNTSVYYAYPASGCYNISDDKNLERVEPAQKSFIGGKLLQRLDDSYKLGDYKLPKSVADACAASLAFAVRGDKYPSQLASLVQGRLRAEQLPLDDVRFAECIVSYLADELAAEQPSRSVLAGNPAAYWLITRLWYRIAIRCWSPLRFVFSVVWPCYRRFTPYSFRTKFIAHYSRNAHDNNGFDYHPKAYEGSPFQSEGASADATVDGSTADGAPEDCRQHDGESDDKSPERSGASAPEPHKDYPDQAPEHIPPVELGDSDLGVSGGFEPDGTRDDTRDFLASAGPLQLQICHNERTGPIIAVTDGTDVQCLQLENPHEKLRNHQSLAGLTEFNQFTWAVLCHLRSLTTDRVDYNVLPKLWAAAYAKNRQPFSTTCVGGHIRSIVHDKRELPARAVRLHGMVFQISEGPPPGTDGCASEPVRDANNKSGRNRQELPQDRSGSKGSRSKKHQSQERSVSVPGGTIHFSS